MKPLGVILAGGQGRRMGGNDKALMTFRGRPLIEHVIDNLAPQVRQIILNINRNNTLFSQYGYPLVKDTHDQYQGPLVGILSVLETLVCKKNRRQFDKFRNTDHHIDLVVVPCDSPFLPSNLCSQLQQEKVRDEYQRNAVANMNIAEQAVVAHDGTRIQPLFILLSTYHLPELRTFINSGNRKVLEWIDLIKPVICKFNNSESLFSNINTPEDLEKIEQQSK